MNQSKFSLFFGSLLVIILGMLAGVKINDAHGHNIDTYEFLKPSTDFNKMQKIKGPIEITNGLTYQILTETNESYLSKNTASPQKFPLFVSFYIFSKHVKPFTPKKTLYSLFNNENQILINNNNQKHLTFLIKNPLLFPTFQLINTSIIRS